MGWNILILVQNSYETVITLTQTVKNTFCVQRPLTRPNFLRDVMLEKTEFQCFENKDAQE